MLQKRVLVHQTVSPRKRMGSGDETNKCLAFLITPLQGVLVKFNINVNIWWIILRVALYVQPELSAHTLATTLSCYLGNTLYMDLDANW